MDRGAIVHRRCGLALALVVIVVIGRASAYVDLAPTLAKIISDAKLIAVVELASFDADAGAIQLKLARTLKGDAPAGPIRHQITTTSKGTIPAQVARWIEPGARGVLFQSRNTTLVCLGRGWYQVRRSGNDRWKISGERPDLPLAFYGSLARLIDGVERMLAGKSAVLTTVAYGADDVATSIDLALNRTNLPGLVRVARINANLRMPPMVMAASANPAYLVGQGPVSEDDLPALIKQLHAADEIQRAEAAEDLGWLKQKAKSAVEPLSSLLDDPASRVRFAAAAALVRISPSQQKALDVLAQGLKHKDAVVRRQAAEATGMAGSAAGELTKSLAALLKDDNTTVREAALQTIATLGPAAADSRAEVIPLLDDPRMAINAADALGRMGRRVRPMPQALVKMLSSNEAEIRWAAVRAMSQIGGDDAKPVVKFMIDAIPKATTVETYNMLIYIALLGPDAKDAGPAINRPRMMVNPMLGPAARWAINPNRGLPWRSGGPFGGPGMFGGDGPDLAKFIYEAYFHELGDRLAPTVDKLLDKLIDGSAGDVPIWGFGLLNCDAQRSLARLVPLLADKEISKRERGVVALGYMGSTAAAAKENLTAALNRSTNDQEKRLIEWSLREIERE
jgi:HEAT repeat protein